MEHHSQARRRSAHVSAYEPHHPVGKGGEVERLEGLSEVDRVESFLFCHFILHGDPLSQRLLFRGPTESLQHTQHNYKQSQTVKSHYLYTYTHTHCVVSGSTFFFKSFRGAGLGLNPEHPITLAQHHH